MGQPMHERMANYIDQLQETIVTKLETYCPGRKFRRERWTRHEGGGGLSCTLDTSPTDSKSPPSPIEKAGVNVSTISGVLPPAAVKQMSTAHAALKNVDKSLPFVAAGLSLIVHPRHPRIPTVHANYRYFEVLDASADAPTALAWWFGTLTDLTPAYPDESSFRHFHTTLRDACDAWSDAAHTALSVYPTFKASCDDYLYVPHRHEHRGIGGVRFDDMDTDAMHGLLRAKQGQGQGHGRVDGQGNGRASELLSEEAIARLSTKEALFDLVKALGDSFLPSFIPILERRVHDPIMPLERRWQLLRRGRAVEFNLVVDRGTKFGLAAPGILAENVLVGMPPEARWEYCSELGAGDQDTEETEMVKILEEPRNWVN